MAKKNSNRSHFKKELDLNRWKYISGSRASVKKERKTAINNAKSMGILQKIKDIAHPDHRVQNKGD